METARFDQLTRTISAVLTRRALAAGLGLGAIVLSNPTAAKKKRKRRKKIRFNEFGCVNVGSHCKNSDQCCSGICQGKQGKKKCQTHDHSTCQAGQDSVVCGGADDDVPCSTSSGHTGGRCSTTTGKGAYCAATFTCFACTKDADCQALCGPQAACVTCVSCEKSGTSTACLGPSEDSCAYT